MTETTGDKFLNIERLGIAVQVLDLPADLWGAVGGSRRLLRTK
jgi:hypothetical protein